MKSVAVACIYIVFLSSIGGVLSEEDGSSTTTTTPKDETDIVIVLQPSSSSSSSPPLQLNATTMAPQPLQLNATTMAQPPLKLNATVARISNVLIDLCLEFLHQNETCNKIYEMTKNEDYFQLTWEVTYRIFFEKRMGFIMFLVWTLFLCVLNFLILYLCTLLKPLRSFLLTKIVSDLRRRYYVSESSEMKIVNNKK